MNMFKKNGGFTLVELIVVIAILAILAAVAVPAYSGYINKANEVADTTALAAVKTAAMGACATEGTVTTLEVVTENQVKITVEAATTTTYTVDYANNKWSCTAAAELGEDFNTFMNSKAIELDYYKSATWTIAGGWVGTK